MLSPHARRIIEWALEEDAGRGDITAVCVPETKQARATLIAKAPCVVSGLWLVSEVVTQAAGNRVGVDYFTADGNKLSSGAKLLELRGPARDILLLERTLLNFLQRTTGIATQAAEYAERVKDLPVRLVDTRKTTPGLRWIEKRAVRDGGLHNHRFALDSGILVKENHIRAAGGITQAVTILKQEAPNALPIQVEVTSREEAREAIAAGAASLLLDNFPPDELGPIVKEIRGYAPKIWLEASGGVNLETVRAFALTGVDCISIGALTHSVRAADLSLLFNIV